MLPAMRVTFVPICALLACASESDSIPEQASQDWQRDVLQTSLDVNVTTRRAIATIELARSESVGASFEVGDLTILSVRSGDHALPFRHVGSQLDVGLPASAPPIEIEYEYHLKETFEGALEQGMTLTWPYYCGNLFPCKSTPEEGLTFETTLTGVPSGMEAVFPQTITGQAPAYMMAWAVGDYTYLDLGKTTAGTQVGVWHLPGGEDTARLGTMNLRDYMQWYETTLGPYPFGSDVASVSVEWGPGVFGGMEHHPYWHVATAAMNSIETHAHEAAHGWFGNGIRIKCWEDFVLSEGTATYLAARAIEAASGVEAANVIWDSYEMRLDRLQQQANANKIAWPMGCGTVDVIEDGLFSEAPYVKGALFFRALETRIGRATLDATLAGFVRAHVGRAATTAELLAHITADTQYDPTACATAWLRTEAVPRESTCP